MLVVLPPPAFQGVGRFSRPVAWALSPDAAVAATLDSGGTLRMWSVDREGVAHPSAILRTESWLSYGPGYSDVLSVSPKGRYVSLHRPGGGYDVWSVASASVVGRTAGPQRYELRRSAWVPTADAVVFEIGPERTRLLRLTDGKTFDLPVGAPWLFTADGKSVLGLAHGELRVFDLATRRVRRRFVGPSPADQPHGFDPARTFPPYVLSTDGRLLASVGNDPDWKGPGEPPADGAFTESAYVRTLRIDIWRFADGKLLRSLPGFFSNLSDADRFQLGFLDGRRLNVPTLGVVLDAWTGRSLQRCDPPLGHSIAEGPIILLPPLPSAPQKERIVKFSGDW